MFSWSDNLLQQNWAPTFEWRVIKVDMPKSSIAIIWPPTFGWYVVRCEFENKHIKKRHVFKKDWTMCPKYPNHSRLSNKHDWEDLYDRITTRRIFNLMTKKTFIWTSEIMRQMATRVVWICYHLTLIVCFISYEKWMQREKYPITTHLPYV